VGLLLLKLISLSVLPTIKRITLRLASARYLNEGKLKSILQTPHLKDRLKIYLKTFNLGEPNLEVSNPIIPLRIILFRIKEE